MVITEPKFHLYCKKNYKKPKKPTTELGLWGYRVPEVQAGSWKEGGDSVLHALTRAQIPHLNSHPQKRHMDTSHLKN